MRPPAFVSSLGLVLSCCCLSRAWVDEDAHVDLLWPPPHNAHESIVDGRPVGPQPEGDQAEFACAHVPIPPDAARVDFPVAGGQIRWNLTSLVPSSALPVGDKYMANAYLGQFNDNTTVSRDNWIYLDGWSWNSTRFASALGPYCTPLRDGLGQYTLNLTDRFQHWYQKKAMAYLVPGFEGMNVTLGTVLVVFGDNGSKMRAIMNTCTYVRLTYNPGSWGPCRDQKTTTTSPPAPTRTDSPHDVGGKGSDDLSMKLAIGLGVGIAVGVAIPLMVCGYFILRGRRRDRDLKAAAEVAAYAKNGKQPADAKDLPELPKEDEAASKGKMKEVVGDSGVVAPETTKKGEGKLNYRYM